MSLKEHFEKFERENPEEYARHKALIAEWEAKEAAADYEHELIIPTAQDVAEAHFRLPEYYVDDEGYPHTRYFLWDKEKVMAFLIKVSCPIVCRGYSTDPERWHDLCIEKAQKAFDKMTGF